VKNGAQPCSFLSAKRNNNRFIGVCRGIRQSPMTFGRPMKFYSSAMTRQSGHEIVNEVGVDFFQLN